MDINKMVACVIGNDDTKNSVFFPALVGTFKSIDMYSLADQLHNDISYVPPGAVVNNPNINQLVFNGLVVHRAIDGTLHFLTSHSRLWRAVHKPTYDELCEPHAAVGAAAEKLLLNTLFNMGLTTKDTPGEIEEAVSLDVLRRCTDYIVCGHSIDEKLTKVGSNERVVRSLNVLGAMLINTQLFNYMVKRGYTWLEMDNNMFPSAPGEYTHTNYSEGMTAFINEHGFDSAVIIHPGLE